MAKDNLIGAEFLEDAEEIDVFFALSKDKETFEIKTIGGVLFSGDYDNFENWVKKIIAKKYEE